MVSWIIIAIVIIFGIIIIKLNHFRHRILIIFLILLALFFYVTLNVVSKENNLDLSTTGGVFHALKVYTGWLANAFQNVKTIVGDVIDMNWKSSNKTFFDDSGNRK